MDYAKLIKQYGTESIFHFKDVMLQHFLCHVEHADELETTAFDNYIADVLHDYKAANLSKADRLPSSIRDDYEFHSDTDNIYLIHRDKVVGYYHGPTLAISDAHHGLGLGAELVMRAALTRGHPPQSDYDEPMYSDAGLGAHRAGFYAMEKMLAIACSITSNKPLKREQKMQIIEATDPQSTASKQELEIALIDACTSGDTPAAKALIAQGVDVNAMSHFSKHEASHLDVAHPLHSAMLNGHLALARSLLDLGADPNLRNDSENALLVAIENEAPSDLIDALLEKDADILCFSAVRSCALDSAAYKGNKPLFLKLLAHSGAGIDDLIFADFNGGNLLMDAAHYGSAKAVDLLIDCGADIRSTDANNNSALHYALSSYNYYHEDDSWDDNTIDQNIEAIARLLEAGLSLSQKNKDGLTPLDKLNECTTDHFIAQINSVIEAHSLKKENRRQAEQAPGL